MATVLQMLHIVGQSNVDRIFKHLNIYSEGRSFKEKMKNLENKIRRLPQYKLLFNDQFYQKRLKNPEKVYKKNPDDLFEKQKTKLNLQNNLTKLNTKDLDHDTRKQIKANMEQLLNDFSKETSNN